MANREAPDLLSWMIFFRCKYDTLMRFFGARVKNGFNKGLARLVFREFGNFVEISPKLGYFATIT